MKKTIILLCLIICSCVLLSACGSNYPENTIFVGANFKFKTIQSAIDASNGSGQTIVLSQQRYKENIYISKPINLRGSTYGCVIEGSCHIASDNVRINTVVFDGKPQKSKVGIEITTDKNIDGLSFYNCKFTNFENGVQSLQKNETTLSNVRFDKCQFSFNGKNGLEVENGKNVSFVNCIINENGKKIKDQTTSGMIFNFIDGNYFGVNFQNCDFKNNGNSNSKSGALLVRARGGEGDSDYKRATYSGAVSLLNCLFVNNSNDIVEGVNNIATSRVETSLTGIRGLKVDIDEQYKA